MKETVLNGTGHAVFVPGEWLFDGNSEKDAAERLGLSPHTVHTYLWRIYRKLRVQSREELLVRVFAEFRALPPLKRAGNGGTRNRQESRRRPL